MSVVDALHIFVPMAKALNYAHEHGIVHRDVKPGNVMTESEIKVADFGIAFVEMSQTLTQPGQIVGSVFYFSPGRPRRESTGVPTSIR